MTVHEVMDSPQRAKLTVEDFLLLDRSGAFEAYAKAELIDGTIFVVNAQFSEHVKAKVRLLRRLADACDASTAGLEAWSEGSVVMSGGNMPEPDVFITRETPMTGPIRVETVALIVEIADTTADFDLGQKAALYAANNVAEYWVMDLKAGQVHQLYAPRADTYAESRCVPFGESVEAVTLSGIRVSTKDL
ncbi:Uma2 family endonuclease [Novosphingobium sp. JCM 18896]|uniref:Uma2 family endonuclease n=1 Tax=Novosphingobium sp. JCM 18896 TaxID=2989731 RepID=UPI00222379C2|nr:Uma2 family endonuclease [Novosphingobium sp. JCM 18896]MCW1431011.1 Uma2 family endonuclease [Novosphingobium sp. JCM 18896]